MHPVVFTAWTLALIAFTDAYAFLQAPRVARGAVRGACGIPIFRVETQRSFHSSQQRKRAGALELLQTATSTYNESASFGARDSQWYLKQITKAWCSNYQGLVKETALDELDSIWGSRVSVLLKREDTQTGHSFHVRGAVNLLSNLRPDQLSKGLISASSGDATIGLAMAAKMIGAQLEVQIPLTAVLPCSTSSLKQSMVLQEGAELILHGDSLLLAMNKAERRAQARASVTWQSLAGPSNLAVLIIWQHAEKLSQERGSLLLPWRRNLGENAMDLSCEAHIIAGLGTIALEIMRQMRTRVDAAERTRGRTAHQPVDAIFVPVESGALLAAIATCMSRISPTTKVIGVEPLPHYSPLPRQVTNETMSHASFHGAPSCYGVESLRLCKAYVHEIVRVDAAQIADAVEHIYRQTRGVVEPAGALALAGASSWLSREASRALTSGVRGLTIIVITSGGNAELASLVSYLDIHQRNRPKEAEGGQVTEGWLRNDLARLGDDLASFGSATRGVLPLRGLLRANGRGVCVKHLRPQRLANICSLRLALPAVSHSTPGRWGKEP